MTDAKNDLIPMTDERAAELRAQLEQLKAGASLVPFEHVEYVEHIMQFFAYDQLPPHLQEHSKPFGEHAQRLVDTLPRNPERTVALRKLLEAKDAAVRAALAKS